MEKTIQFNYQAHYHQSHELNEEVTEIWFVIHGYGQLAKYFIRKFNSIASPERVIIAPGGLSRFYLEGFDGRVGATWMTKEDRLLDIDNYINYLEAVYKDVLLKASSKDLKVNFLGFSQGAATVTRWLQKHEGSFDRLIIWAGNFPHDMDIDQVSKQLKDKKVQMVRGLQDPFINEKAKTRQKEVIEALELDVEHFTFEGGHDIDQETLKKLV